MDQEQQQIMEERERQTLEWQNEIASVGAFWLSVQVEDIHLNAKKQKIKIEKTDILYVSSIKIIYTCTFKCK